MSWRSDSAQWITAAWVSSAYPGLGVRGSAIKAIVAGENGLGALYNDVQAGDENKEFRWLPTPPGVGAFTSYEDGSFGYVGPSTSFQYTGYVDGVAYGTSTVTLAAAAGGGASPTLTGTITPSAITQTSYTLTISAASNNIGIDVSINGGGSYTQLGNVTTISVTSRTAGAVDYVRVRARAADGSTSTPELTLTVNLLTVAPAPTPAPAPAPTPAPAPALTKPIVLGITSAGALVILA